MFFSVRAIGRSQYRVFLQSIFMISCNFRFAKYVQYCAWPLVVRNACRTIKTFRERTNIKDRTRE
jgi:hypothetical protein